MASFVGLEWPDYYIISYWYTFESIQYIWLRSALFIEQEKREKRKKKDFKKKVPRNQMAQKCFIWKYREIGSEVQQ